MTAIGWERKQRGVWVWGRHSKSVAGLGVIVSRHVYKWQVWTGRNMRLGRSTGKQGGAMQCKCSRAWGGYCWGGGHAMVHKWPGRVYGWQRGTNARIVKSKWVMGRYSTCQQDLGWLVPGGGGYTNVGRCGASSARPGESTAGCVGGERGTARGQRGTRRVCGWRGGNTHMWLEVANAGWKKVCNWWGGMAQAQQSLGKMHRW